MDDIQAAGASRPAAFDDGFSPIPPDGSQWGYQILQSGHFNTIGADKITWMLGYGQGRAVQLGARRRRSRHAVVEEGLVCSTSTTS